MDSGLRKNSVRIFTGVVVLGITGFISVKLYNNLNRESSGKSEFSSYGSNAANTSNAGHSSTSYEQTEGHSSYDSSKVSEYLHSKMQLKSKISGKEHADLEIEAYRMFSRGPLAKIGNDKMPFVLFRILPLVAQRLGSRIGFGSLDEPYKNYGFFKDSRPEYAKWPTPYGFTWGVPSEFNPMPVAFPDQPKMSYMVRTCGSCHSGQMDHQGQMKILVGAANRELEQHALTADMNIFLREYFGPNQQAQTQSKILEVLDEVIKTKSVTWFYNNQESFDDLGKAVAFTDQIALEQIALFRQNIAAVMKDMYGVTETKKTVLEKMQEQYNRAPSNRKKQLGHIGPAGTVDSNTLGILSILVGYNKLAEMSNKANPQKNMKIFDLAALSPGSTKVDIPNVWQQGKKKLFQIDASVTNMFFRDAIAALGFVDHPVNLNAVHLETVSRFIDELPAPAYPENIDPVLKARGETVFKEARCTACHIPDQRTLAANANPRVFQMGTSPNRHLGQSSKEMLGLAVGAVMAACKNPWTQGIEIDVKNGELEASSVPCKYDSKNILLARELKDQGYPANPLDGAWAKAPYLHNGSVPTLWHLLGKSSAQSVRPATFVVSALSYDFELVGWSWNAESANSLKAKYPSVSVYDTAFDGFANGGHEAFSADGRWQDPITDEWYKLSWDIETEKEDLLALIEYLKSI